MPDELGAPTSDSTEPDGPAEPEPHAEPNVDARAAALLREAEETAAARGREMVNEARAVRRRMLDDLERRREAFLEELARVRATIDDLSAGLDEEITTEPDARAPAAPPRDAVRPPTEPRAEDAFARLREDHPPDQPPARPATPTPAPAPTDGAVDVVAPAAVAPPSPEPEPAAPAPPDPDDATRRRRDEMLAPLTVAVLRASKRLLQDEHNELLDTTRRARGKVDAARLLPDPEKQHTAWSAVLAPTIDAAYTVGRALTGRGRRPTNAPRRLVAELAAAVVMPLRERLTVTIDSVLVDGPYESPAELHNALGPAISARYREWRTSDLEGLLGDQLAAAYARGAFDAAPSGARLRWVPAELGQCPDADDNALEPTVKGQPFPTGQPYPPAHPGCRCLIVPTGEGSAQPSV